MEPWGYAALVGVGAVSGFVNVMAGGGSLLTLPLMIFLGLPPATANGTNRIAILAQSAVSVAEFRRRGRHQRRHESAVTTDIRNKVIKAELVKYN